MTFDPGAVRQALADTLDGLAAAYGVKLRAIPYVPDSIDPPFAYPADMSWVVDSADDTVTATVAIRILTSSAEDRAGQEHLDVLIPAATAALDAVSAYSVDSGTGYDVFPVGPDGDEFYGAELEVRVLA